MHQTSTRVQEFVVHQNEARAYNHENFMRCKQTFNHLIMAPQTRLQALKSSQIRAIRAREYDTPRKSRFFEAFDSQSNSKPFTSICDELDIHRNTGYRWLRERDQIGSPAYRKTRRRSGNLGRKSGISKTKCKFLVSRGTN